MAQKADIVICGAGIAGISAAYHLAVRHGYQNILMVDERAPLSLTSDKSTECYRNWWPGPGDAMVAFMNRSIDLEVTGGLGLAPGGNINPHGLSMYEPVHGSAPKYKCMNTINPTATILAAKMLVDNMGRRDLGSKVEEAVRRTFDKGIYTQDLGGKAKTSFQVIGIACVLIYFPYHAPVGGWIKREDDPLWIEAPEPFRRSVEAVRTLEAAVTGAAGIEGLVLRYGHVYGPGTAYGRGGAFAKLLERGFSI